MCLHELSEDEIEATINVFKKIWSNLGLIKNLMCNIKLRNFKIKDINNVYIRALNNKKLMQFSENRFRLFNKKNCLEYFKSMKKNKNFFF